MLILHLYLSLCRALDVDADRRRREIYARNAVMGQWAQRNMALFHEQMVAQAGGGAPGFAV